MSEYYINGRNVRELGVVPARIGKLTGYLLEGCFDLPKRLGDSLYDWQGEVEPYVDADDIVLDGRDLSLSLVCKSSAAAELKAKMETFKAQIPDSFTLSNDRLGSFNVGLKAIEIKPLHNRWAQIELKLREPRPTIGGVLPEKDNGAHGIDGYSWKQLGLVVSELSDRHSLPSWQTLNVTVSPKSDTWKAGFRQPRTVTINGTLCGNSHEDFAQKVAMLQTLLASAGVRTLKYYDSTQVECFCTEGFKISPVHIFPSAVWGGFTCKLIMI